MTRSLTTPTCPREVGCYPPIRTVQSPTPRPSRGRDTRGDVEINVLKLQLTGFPLKRISVDCSETNFVVDDG